MKISVHVFWDSIENASRLMKETSSMLKLGLVDKIHIYGIGKSHLDRVSVVNENCVIYRSPILVIPKFLSRFFFLKRIFSLFNFLLFHLYVLIKVTIVKPQYISCHNLMLLPLSKWCKGITGSVFIYEPHELETERTGLVGRAKRISAWIEHKYIYSADKVLTVCKPIEDWYRSRYNLNNVYTLRNIPLNPLKTKEFKRTKLLRSEFNIPDEHIVFIYQGVLDPARGIVELVELFKSISNDKHLVLMGYGRSAEWIIENSCENIHYMPAVPVEKIIEYTSSADVGLIFINHKVSLSYKYSLPNKFFEYLMAGLPVIVSNNLSYLSDIINENKLGWVYPTQSNELKDKINNLSKLEINALKDNISLYSSQNDWKLEESKLLDLYNIIIAN